MVEAQQLVLAAWSVLAALLLGVGLLERRVTGHGVDRAGDLWSVLWTGWALLLCFLQVWHFFLPVDDSARIAAGVLALAGWIGAGKGPWLALARALPRNAIGLAAVAAGAVWLSNRCLAGPSFGDTGLYLIPMVHWDETFPAVPGLANLYVPFGHNLSYFLYGAFLDAGPLVKRIYPVVNSTLAMAIVARGLLGWARLLRRGGGRATGDLFHALALVPMADLACSYALTSPMPDTAVFLFGLVLAGELVELLAAEKPSRAATIRLVLLCGAGITLKLSIAGLAVATAAMALLVWIRRTSPGASRALATTLLAALASLLPVGTWMLGNVVTSGYPLYPASLFPFPVDWIARVDATAWIQKPMAMAPLWTIFRDWTWWQTRLLSLGWMEADALRPLAAIAAGALLFALFGSLRRWRGRALPLTSLVLLAPLVGFFFCFANTPMPRYQGATMWIVAIDLFVLALAGPVAEAGLAPRLAAFVLVAFGMALPVARGVPAWLPLKDFEPVGVARVHEQKLASGLVVQVPENSVCWYAPLPCTPEPHASLRLREDGNLAAGFAMDAEEAN